MNTLENLKRIQKLIEPYINKTPLILIPKKVKWYRGDNSTEPSFKPEIAEDLRKFFRGELEIFDADDVARELGFDK